MRINPKNEDLSTRSSGKLKGQAQPDELNLYLEALDDFDFSLDEPKKSAFIANESSVKVLPVEAPQHIIRRAIRDLESGSLDELLVHRLIGLDRESAEFRQKYIDLRVESLMRPRSSFSPCTELVANEWVTKTTVTNKPSVKVAPQEINYKSPWAVNTLGDLWNFFGPWLTLIFAMQLYYSYKLGSMLGSMLGKDEILHENLPVNIGTLIIALVSLLTSILVVMRCKGQDYNNFKPRLAGIGIVSALIAIASYLLLDVL